MAGQLGHVRFFETIYDAIYLKQLNVVGSYEFQGGLVGCAPRVSRVFTGPGLLLPTAERPV